MILHLALNEKSHCNTGTLTSLNLSPKSYLAVKYKYHEKLLQLFCLFFSNFC